MGWPAKRRAPGFLENWAALYTKPTEAERAIEPAIARLGKPYRAQHPVFSAHSIVDFALLEDRIIIEVDGNSHVGPKAREADRKRTHTLETLGWTVVRCWNSAAIREPDATVQKLLLEAADRKAALLTLKPQT